MSRRHLMITFLSKLFINNNNNYNDPSVRRSYGILSSIMGIVLNLLLFAGKYFAGIVSGSIAITADAFNNLSDSGSSIITLIGFKLSGAKPDARHPFGHGRMEYLSGLAVSALIIVMGVELIISSIRKIIETVSVSSDATTIAILVISILIKFYMYWYNHRLAKKTNSEAMSATATDSISDVVTTCVVLISVIVASLTNLNIDGYCGVAVGLFILYSGIQSLRETLSPLLGRPANPELVKQIEDIVMANEEILAIHDLIVHDYGPGHLIISLHGEVDGSKDIYLLHSAIDSIEKELDDRLGCTSCLHMDPVIVGDKKTKQMYTILSHEIKTIDPRITIHDFRIVGCGASSNLIFDAVLPFDLAISDDDARAQIDQLVKSLWPSCNIVLTIDKSYT